MMGERKEGTRPFLLFGALDLLLSEVLCLPDLRGCSSSTSSLLHGMQECMQDKREKASPMRIVTSRYVQGKETTVQDSAAKLL